MKTKISTVPEFDVSIVTPCFNMLPHLKKCVLSVADQNVPCEHIVIDGASSDGTREWLHTAAPGLVWKSEKDNGMYDALNKGLQMAKGEIIGHINADEQYLPGTLKFVTDYFRRHPDVDFVVADFFLVDNNGNLKAFRKGFHPFWPFFFSNYMYTFTCTLFYRRRVLEQIRYDSAFKSIADVDFLSRVIRAGFKGRHVRRYVAAFTLTGKNLTFDPVTEQEKLRYQLQRLPRWYRLVKPIMKLGFLVARVAFGTLWHKGAVEYELFTDVDSGKRTQFSFREKTWKWT